MGKGTSFCYKRCVCYISSLLLTAKLLWYFPCSCFSLCGVIVMASLLRQLSHFKESIGSYYISRYVVGYGYSALLYIQMNSGLPQLLVVWNLEIFSICCVIHLPML